MKIPEELALKSKDASGIHLDVYDQEGEICDLSVTVVIKTTFYSSKFLGFEMNDFERLGDWAHQVALWLKNKKTL